MKTKTYEYRVQGSLHFPLDMLRYDNAEPATSCDAATIESINNGDIPLGHSTQVLIRGTRIPTIDRWRSFGWTVIDARKV